MNRRFCLQKGGSQERISSITIMFCFNEFAFTVQVKHKIKSRLYKFLALFWYVCILRLAISTRVLCKECSLFPFNSWLSFQRLCRLLWGYHFHFVDRIMLQIILWFLSLPGTCVYSGLQDVGNRHDAGLLNWETFCFSCRHLEVLGMYIPSCKPLKQLYKQQN